METQATGSVTILIVGFLFLLFVAIGVLLIILHNRNKQKAEDSLSWLGTKGTVSVSRVRQGKSMLSSDDEAGEGTPVYSPEISYTYQVAGVDYTSNRLSFSGTKSFSKQADAEKAASIYPIGTQLPVYYNPNNPKEAVSDRTAKVSNMLLIFGIMFIIIGLVTLLVGVIVLL